MENVKRGLGLIAFVVAVTVTTTGAYYGYAGKWGSWGTGNGQFWTPCGVAVRWPSGGGTNDVYVADTWNHRIQYFSPTGGYQGKWGSEGSGNNQFERPYGIGINWWNADRVFVADTWNHRISRFDPSGSYECKWSTTFPADVDVASNGYVYVVSPNDYVKYYTGAGSFIGSWGANGTGNGQFKAPYGIGCACNGTVYVADTFNHRVQYFTSTGSYLGKWGSEGSGNGQFDRPCGLAVGTDGRVYVADTYNCRCQQFTSTGSFLQAWGSYGTGNGQFNYPHDIDVSQGGDYAYVTDTDNNRIQYFYDSPLSPDDDYFKAGTNVIPTSLGKVKAIFK
jgi:DNA-binding beta-propeller fold protein YncE